MTLDHDDLRVGQDIIDSRDLIALAAEIRALAEEEERELTEEEQDTLEAIDDAASAGLPDWEYGEALIHENYFTTYAQDLATDIGAVNDDHGWPLTFIDWDAAADALKMDYTIVEMFGHTYYGRA